MLDEREIGGLDRQISDYFQTREERHATQGKFLEDIQQLIADYRQLQSDYEEARESRDKYKKMARGGERGPFVLLLVDGDSYIVSPSFCSFPRRMS